MHLPTLFCVSTALLLKSTVAQETSAEVDESLEGYDHQLLADGIFERDIHDAKLDFGDEVDISLEGYDHELVTRNLLAKRGGFGDASLHTRDQLSQEGPSLLHEDGQEVDFSLEGYDHDLVARSLEGMQELELGGMPEVEAGEGAMDKLHSLGSTSPVQTIHVRRVSEHNAEEKRSLSADSTDETVEDVQALHLLTRRAALAEEEAAVRGSLGDDIDYSLDGYDHSLFSRDTGNTDGDREDVKSGPEGYDHDLVVRSLQENLLMMRELIESDEKFAADAKEQERPPQAARGYFEKAGIVARQGASAAWSTARLWFGNRLF